MKYVFWTFNKSVLISSDVTSCVTMLFSRGCVHGRTNGFPRECRHDGLDIYLCGLCLEFENSW